LTPQSSGLPALTQETALFSTQYIYVFCVDLGTVCDYFLKSIN